MKIAGGQCSKAWLCPPGGRSYKSVTSPENYSLHDTYRHIGIIFNIGPMPIFTFKATIAPIPIFTFKATIAPIPIFTFKAIIGRYRYQSDNIVHL